MPSISPEAQPETETATSEMAAAKLNRRNRNFVFVKAKRIAHPQNVLLSQRHQASQPRSTGVG